MMHGRKNIKTSKYNKCNTIL